LIEGIRLLRLVEPVLDLGELQDAVDIVRIGFDDPRERRLGRREIARPDGEVGLGVEQERKHVGRRSAAGEHRVHALALQLLVVGAAADLQDQLADEIARGGSPRPGLGGRHGAARRRPVARLDRRIERQDRGTLLAAEVADPGAAALLLRLLLLLLPVLRLPLAQRIEGLGACRGRQQGCGPREEAGGQHGPGHLHRSSPVIRIHLQLRPAGAKARPARNPRGRLWVR
jgi:hypothetical protein